MFNFGLKSELSQTAHHPGVEGVSFLNAYRQIFLLAMLVPVVPGPIARVLHP